MDFAYSPKVQELRERVSAFMEAHVYPAEAGFGRQVPGGDRCSCPSPSTVPGWPTTNMRRWRKSWAVR